MYLSFACPKERYQRKRHQGGEDFVFSPSLDPPSFKRPKGACEPLLDFPGILRGAIAASSETTAVLASSAAALKRKMPPCGARKTLRAYADPRVFRPLRKKRAAFFCHRQRQHAFPRADGDAQKTVVHERPFLSSTGRGAFFLFGKTKRKNGGRISQPHPAPGARSFVSRSHDSAARCAGRRGRRPLRRRGTPELFQIANSELRIPNYPTGFPGSGSCRSPPPRGGSRGRCSR